ncbi:hypothetical protein BH24GEM2_BH24GEM2_00820 [soil metagenome]
MEFQPSQAQAQFVVHDPIAMVNHAAQYAGRLYEIEQKRQQIIYQIQSLKKLGNPSWREIGGYMQQLDDLMAQGRAIGYSLANLNREFEETFPGFRVPEDWSAQQRTQFARTMATMQAALNFSQRQAQQMAVGNAQLRAIKGSMAGVQGTQEALELQGTLMAYTAEELQMLRQAIAAQTNAQTVYNAHQLQQQEQAQASFDAMLRETRSRPRPRYRTFDGSRRRQ